MNRKWIWIGVSILVLAALGCSLGGLLEGVQETGEQAQELAEDAQDLVEEEATEMAPEEATEAAPEEEGEGAPVDIEPGALEGLDSYRSLIVVRSELFDGTTEEMTMEMKATRDPAAQHIIVTGDATEGQSVEIVQIGNQQWLRFGEEWIQTEADEAEALNFEEDLPFSLEDIEEQTWDDAAFVGQETVNGISTRHYRVQDMGWESFLTAEAEIESATAEYWIADEANLPAFPVKMVVEISGKDTDVEDDLRTYFMSMEVTDVNADLVIEPPAEAESGGLPEDIPLYPNRKNQTSMGGMLVFETEDAFESVADFYASEMEAAGWSLEEGGMSTEDMVMQTWTKDGRSAQVMISVDEGVVSVTVIIGEGE